MGNGRNVKRFPEGWGAHYSCIEGHTCSESPALLCPLLWVIPTGLCTPTHSHTHAHMWVGTPRLEDSGTQTSSLSPGSFGDLSNHSCCPVAQTIRNLCLQWESLV